MGGELVNVPVEDSAFKLPAPPPPDFALAGGKTSTTVPFELVNNHIYVDVRLNGKGPYRLMCDTGGANIVTPELFRATFADELAKVHAALGPDVYDNGRFAEATKLFEDMSLAPTFEEFLTLPAYKLID